MNKLASVLAALTLPLWLGAQTQHILVGTYTRKTPAEGVYLYAFDAASARTELLDMAPSGNPSFVILSKDGKYAYAVNEFSDGQQGVSSFVLKGNRIRACQSILIPKEKVHGEAPCNLLLTRKAIVTSNYTGGSASVFPMGRGGRLRAMSEAFAPGGEPKSHMHCAVSSPDGKYLFLTDLGKDCIHRFTPKTGTRILDDGTLAWKNSDTKKYGPRHLVFSADGRFAYLLCELGDMLVVFSYSDGLLTPIQTLQAYDGEGHGSADIHLSPDGRFLYTSHRRKKDGISIFSVDTASGRVTWTGFQPTGRHPRNFAISPDGRYLLCACRDDNKVEIYRIDPAGGALIHTGESIPVGAPVCVQFIPDRSGN